MSLEGETFESKQDTYVTDADGKIIAENSKGSSSDEKGNSITTTNTYYDAEGNISFRRLDFNEPTTILKYGQEILEKSGEVVNKLSTLANIEDENPVTFDNMVNKLSDSFGDLSGASNEESVPKALPEKGLFSSIKQLANLLGIKLYNFGFVADEITAIKGYNDYQGKYVATPFYEIYKNGGICFFDEVDNSESKDLMELNKIIGSDGYEPYLFPNGEIVKPHPNFRIIAAGNTWGDGADSLYSTRERLDAATMNRFAGIDYGYDKAIERKILSNYLTMYEFATAFRGYIDEKNYDDIISTRDMEDIKQYLDNGLPLEEILEIKFIKNKRVEVLNSISNYIDEQLYRDNDVNDTFKHMISKSNL